MAGKKQNTIHILSHTHWDREWHLTFQVFRMRLVRLIDDLLDLLDQDPDYRYYMLDGQTIVLDDYLQVRPEREADLRRHIQAGRLFVGPWHILPDEFLVSPEASVRNLLQGERTARRFGGKMSVGYIPDPFGHIGQMPQILAGFGIRYASVQRGLSDEPCEFWWQAPDGSRVLMNYMRDGYGNAVGLPADRPDEFVDGLCERVDSLAPHSLTGHLVMMHGIDHCLPQPGTSRAIERARRNLPASEVLHSSFPAVFEAIEAAQAERGLEFPVVAGELRDSKRHPLLPGVLSTRTWIKQRSHAGEVLLEKWAEPFSALATLVSPGENIRRLPRRPGALLRQAWRQLMECHPHDSICGCSIDQVHEEMPSRFDQVDQIGEEVTQHSLDHLALQVDTCPPDALASQAPYQAIVVFNPTDAAVDQAAEVEVDGLRGLQIIDAAGRPVEAEILSAEARPVNDVMLDRQGLAQMFRDGEQGLLSGLNHYKLNLQDARLESRPDGWQIDLQVSYKVASNPGMLARVLPAVRSLIDSPRPVRFNVIAASHTTRLRFLAKNIPAHGYRTYWVRPAPPVAQPATDWETITQGSIANETLTVEVSPQDGGLTLIDRLTGQVYPGLNRFVDGGEAGDEYNYSPPANDRLLSPRLQAIRRKVTPIEQTLEVRLVLDTPTGLTEDRRARRAETIPMEIVTTARLTKGGRTLEIHTEVEQHAEDHRLQVLFPTPFRARQAAFDGHYEVVRRPIRLPQYDATWIEQPRPEMPQRCFTAVEDAGSRQGVVIANRGLREAAVVEGADGRIEIALTLLRCVGWLSRGDLSTRRGDAGPRIATPGAQQPGRWSFDYAVIPYRPGDALDAYHTAYAFNAPLRSVSTGLHAGPLAGVQSFVRADHPAFVISALKAAEDDRGVVLRGYSLADEPIDVELTLWKPFASVARCTLAEEPLEPLSLSPDNRLRLALRPHEIVSMRLMDL